MHRTEPTPVTTMGCCTAKGPWYSIASVVMISDNGSFTQELPTVVSRTQIYIRIDDVVLIHGLPGRRISPLYALMPLNDSRVQDGNKYVMWAQLAAHVAMSDRRLPVIRMKVSSVYWTFWHQADAQNDRRTLLTGTGPSASSLQLGIASSLSSATKKWCVGVTGDKLQASGEQYVSFYSGCLSNVMFIKLRCTYIPLNVPR
jgi:hypothetical protein